MEELKSIFKAVIMFLAYFSIGFGGTVFISKLEMGIIDLPIMGFLILCFIAIFHGTTQKWI